MKLIEAMKQRKDLQKKAEDLRQKIGQYSAHSSIESPVYGTEQGAIVKGWVQAHQDIVKQMRNLSIAIQKTNLTTKVSMTIAGETVELSVAEWILRRRELAGMEAAVWNAMNDRQVKTGTILASDGKTQQAVQVIRYYDPVQRDKMVDAFTHEPSQIDARLEVVNATTELIDA